MIKMDYLQEGAKVRFQGQDYTGDSCQAATVLSVDAGGVVLYVEGAPFNYRVQPNQIWGDLWS